MSSSVPRHGNAVAVESARRSHRNPVSVSYISGVRRCARHGERAQRSRSGVRAADEMPAAAARHHVAGVKRFADGTCDGEIARYGVLPDRGRDFCSKVRRRSRRREPICRNGRKVRKRRNRRNDRASMRSWREQNAGHLGAGSTGEALSNAGAAGDPWATAIPGAYGAGTAGKIVGDNVNATISSRATQASVDTVDGIVDDILLDTAEIGTAGAGLTNINLPNQTMDIVGNITGNLSGSVGSVTGLTASNLDATISSRMATYAQPTGFLAATFPAGTVANTTNITAGIITTATNLTTNNDKTGYALSAAGVQAIWDALTAALTTVGSIGKWIVDKLDVVVSTRLASSGYTAPLDAAGTRTAIGMASANLDTQLDALPTAVENADSLLDRANAIETGWTIRRVLRIVFAALGGKATGLDTGLPIYRSGDDSKDRITAVTDTAGNRSAVTLDGT